MSQDIFWGKYSSLRVLLTLLAMAAVPLGSPAVMAGTLSQALSSTYTYNPRIEAERARLRATDESVAEAHAGYRPTITGSGNLSIQDNRSRTRDEDVGGAGFAAGIGVTTGARAGDTIYPRGYSINLQQNLFNGFGTTNAVNEAEANVRAGREVLRDIERTVFLDAVTAYMDVIRDKAIVRLRQNNVRVLSRELQATRDRFSVGEVTRTDVAQAEARRAGAISELDLAKANLKTSLGSYERVVGVKANRLRTPSVPRKLIPATVNQAKSIGVNESPIVIQALYREQAARFAVSRARAGLLPTLDLQASYTNNFDSSSTTAESDTTVLEGRLNVPFYQGGRVSAQVRAAKHTHVSRIQEIEDARTQARQDVVAAWSQYQAAQAQLRSDTTQVSSNRTALEGVREEEKVGQRTLLDVLNAELELLNSQVNLETTRRNLVVASYAVLSAMGRLDAANLGVSAHIYDAEQHYYDVRRKWWGVSITHGDGREEHMDLWDSHGRKYSAD